MSSIIRQFLKDDGGATAIEYGLMAALIASAIAVAATTLGANLSDMFTMVSDEI